MEKIYEDIAAYIDSHREEMLEKLKELVNLEGHFEEKENVEQARSWLQKELEAEGFVCRVREVAPDRAGILIGILGENRPGKPVMFTGHVDTVHHKGSFGGDNPFRAENGMLYGPGVLDMKGGLIIALYAAKALNAIGYDSHTIKFLVDGVAESDHVGNDCDKYMTEESRGCLAAFNLECGELGNRLCTARKSQFTFYLTVDGVGGHAGNDFLRGKNAIHEAVYKIEEIIKLTDLEKGTTVTTAVIKGGGHTSGIADHCEVVFDVRVNNEDEAKRILDAMHEIAGRTYIEGTTTKLDYYRAKLAPLQETEDVLKLFNLVNKVAVDSGFEPFGKIHRGGATDAGNIYAAGVPVVDACGIRGDFAHNKKEYGVQESLYDRAKIFAGAVAKIEEM